MLSPVFSEPALIPELNEVAQGERVGAGNRTQDSVSSLTLLPHHHSTLTTPTDGRLLSIWAS